MPRATKKTAKPKTAKAKAEEQELLEGGTAVAVEAPPESPASRTESDELELPTKPVETSEEAAPPPAAKNPPAP